jgi:Mn2+/Fe2+ NRAMP family transporter
MKRLNSKKLYVTILAIVACVYSMVLAKQCGYNYLETVIVVPSVVMAVSVICVTYLTGQAKIDIKESISIGGQDVGKGS